MTLFPARILVGLDIGDVSDHAADVANEICLRTESELHLAHVKLTAPSMRGRPMGPAQQEKLDEEGKDLPAQARRAPGGGGGAGSPAPTSASRPGSRMRWWGSRRSST